MISYYWISVCLLISVWSRGGNGIIWNRKDDQKKNTNMDACTNSRFPPSIIYWILNLEVPKVARNGRNFKWCHNSISHKPQLLFKLRWFFSCHKINPLFNSHLSCSKNPKRTPRFCVFVNICLNAEGNEAAILNMETWITGDQEL